MVRIKNAGCRKCCCNDCGIHPRGDAKLCCYCHCDELCVEILSDTYGSDPIPCDVDCICLSSPLCECINSRNILSWDDANCWFSGFIGCGTSLIDIKVQVKRYSGSCYVCVDSVCLNLSGEEGGNGCFPLADCGEYRVDCDPQETTLVTLSGIDISGCGDADCTTATITIKCQNIINPQPDPPICSDCDCLCECICMTYNEGGCAETKVACWDESIRGWEVTFGDGCPFASQTIRIALVKVDNCCHWRVTTTRGTVDGTDVPTNCPRPIEHWTLDDIAATLDIACSTCDKCELDAVCCDDDLPETLYARVCAPCGDVCVPLVFQGATASTASWISSSFVIQCTDGFDFACKDMTIAIEFECLENGTLWQIVIWCLGVAVQTELPAIQCDPFCASHSASIDGSQCGFAGVTCIDGVEICISERPC